MTTSVWVLIHGNISTTESEKEKVALSVVKQKGNQSSLP